MNHGKACDCVDCKIIRRDNTIIQQAEQIEKWKADFEEMSEFYGNAVKKDFKQSTTIAEQTEQIAELEKSLSHVRLTRDGWEQSYEHVKAENQRQAEQIAELKSKYFKVYRGSAEEIERLQAENKRLKAELAMYKSEVKNAERTE